MRKKIVTLLLVGMLATSVTACGGSSDTTDTSGDGATQDASAESQEPVKEHYEIDLSAGNYIAGKDVPVGTYNITATSGSGNVSSSNMYNGGLNEVMGAENDGISQQSFNGLAMDENVTLSVGGNVVIHLVAEDAQTGNVTARGEASGTPVDLQAGNYTSGTDFPAGTYTIVATGGSNPVCSIF